VLTHYLTWMTCCLDTVPLSYMSFDWRLSSNLSISNFGLAWIATSSSKTSLASSRSTKADFRSKLDLKHILRWKMNSAWEHLERVLQNRSVGFMILKYTDFWILIVLLLLFSFYCYQITLSWSFDLLSCK